MFLCKMALEVYVLSLKFFSASLLFFDKYLHDFIDK